MGKGSERTFPAHSPNIESVSRLFDTVLFAEQNCTTYETEPEKAHGSVKAAKPLIAHRENYLAEIQQFERNPTTAGLSAYCGGLTKPGRGALAGPVVAAAVILPIGCQISGVTDFKTADTQTAG